MFYMNYSKEQLNQLILLDERLDVLHKKYGFTLDQAIVDFHNNRNSKMPTKHIMTRAEAIRLLNDSIPHVANGDKIIDFYIEAGMLEIKEEEKKLTLREIAVKFNLDLVKFLTILEQNGYNIARDNS